MMVIEQGFAGHAGLGRLEAGDGERLGRFFQRLSPETVYRRFLSPIARPDQLERLHLLDLDGAGRQALLALVDGEIVGEARFARDGESAQAAELAIVVADEWQGQGLGARLLAALADAAREAGIERFTFVTLPENRAVIRLLKRFAPDTHLEFASGLIQGWVPLRAA